jgi:hypothetical protein
MSTERVARWLHLSDLDCPSSDDPGWVEAVRDTLTRWQKLRPARGYDVVLVSGNVTRDGHPNAFARASRLVGELRHSLGGGADGAVVLAVPGAQDVSREAPAGGVADRGAEAAFAAWQAWWQAQAALLPESVVLREGILPGDFSATITLADRGVRIGVVGINTVTGHEDAPARPPQRLGERLRAVCGSTPAAWSRHHHVAVLLTQHPPMDEEGGTASWAEVTDAKLSLHHCGRGRSAPRVAFGASDRATEVLSAWTFSGYSAEGIGGMHRIRPQGGVVVSLHLLRAPFAALTATEYDTGPGSVRKPEQVAMLEWVSVPSEELPEGLPAPMLRGAEARGEEQDRELSRDEVSDLLWAVLPEDADFRGFTFSELRDVHTELPRAASRDTRTKRLLTLREPAKVLEALQRYLPDTTAERLKELRGTSRR